MMDAPLSIRYTQVVEDGEVAIGNVVPVKGQNLSMSLLSRCQVNGERRAIPFFMTKPSIIGSLLTFGQQKITGLRRSVAACWCWSIVVTEWSVLACCLALLVSASTPWRSPHTTTKCWLPGGTYLFLSLCPFLVLQLFHLVLLKLPLTNPNTNMRLVSKFDQVLGHISLSSPLCEAGFLTFYLSLYRGLSIFESSNNKMIALGTSGHP